MLTLFKNGKILKDGEFIRADILSAVPSIIKIGLLDEKDFLSLDIDIVDCKNKLIIPGLIDPHIHLSGGSGEAGGFSTQTPAINVSECVLGGITTVVGTLGVDTTTKSMNELLARVKGFNDVGLTAFCYTGGYDVPPKTVTNSVREDLIFISEIIGVGEIAIADHRAPEPSLKDLARASIDAFVGGMLANKAGVTHFHVGAGKRKLQSVRDLLEQHEILPEKIYITHIDRTVELFEEAVQLAKKGCYIDIDIYERDFYKWIQRYKELDGPRSHFTFSSDGGVPCPTEVWEVLRECVQKHKMELSEVLPFVTTNTAEVLKLQNKGIVSESKDADLVVCTEKDLDIIHVYAKGKSIVKDSQLNVQRHPHSSRRGLDIYGTIERKN